MGRVGCVRIGLGKFDSRGRLNQKYSVKSDCILNAGYIMLNRRYLHMIRVNTNRVDRREDRGCEMIGALYACVVQACNWGAIMFKSEYFRGLTFGPNFLLSSMSAWK